MASVTLNPVFTGISGSVGRLVFYRWNNKTVARRYLVPRNPDTPAQRNNRNLFRDAMKSWQSLGDKEKAAYNKKAARLPMTGHNLYISRYMRMRSAAQASSPGLDETAAVSGASRAGSLNHHSHTLSVTAPSAQAYRVFSPPSAGHNPPG